MTNEATPVEKQEPQGIGGWLLLAILYLFVCIYFLTYEIIFHFDGEILYITNKFKYNGNRFAGIPKTISHQFLQFTNFAFLLFLKEKVGLLPQKHKFINAIKLTTYCAHYIFFFYNLITCLASVFLSFILSVMIILKNQYVTKFIKAQTALVIIHAFCFVVFFKSMEFRYNVIIINEFYIEKIILLLLAIIFLLYFKKSKRVHNTFTHLNKVNT